MPHLALYDIGEEVVVQGPPTMRAVILSKSFGTVTVNVFNESNGTRGQTQWSPQTVVRKYYPDKSQTEAPKTTPQATSQPVKPNTPPKPASPLQKPLQKPTGEKAKPAESKPKVKPQLDVFGVRMGTMAAAVNAYLLQKRKGISVADVLANVKGSKKDNVNSHLRRMVNDKLLDNKGEGRTLLVSVPKAIK